MRATAAPERPPPPTSPAPMHLLSILLAPRTSKKAATPNLGGFFAAQSTNGDSSGDNKQLPSLKSNPTSHHRLGAPASAGTTPTQGDGACAASLCDAIASKSPRTLPLQRIILCFNVLETMDFYVVQQQAVRTIHIYTPVVVKACVFEQY